jgi:hypothetical protein
MNRHQISSIVALIVIAVLSLVIIVSPKTTQAHTDSDQTSLFASPSGDYSEPWGANGCGNKTLNVPDGDPVSYYVSRWANRFVGTGKKNIFETACNKHDWCYQTKYADKSRCDYQFGLDLDRACKDFYGFGIPGLAKGDPFYYECKSAAGYYYKAVDLFGKKAYLTAQASGLKNQGSCTNPVYRVAVFTSNKDYSGTNANVSITLVGKSSSNKIPLDNAGDDFEKWAIDVYFLRAGDIGALKQITIGHDNAGKDAGWYLEKVVVQNMCNATFSCFPHNKWLAKDEGDGKLYHTIKAANCP